MKSEFYPTTDGDPGHTCVFEQVSTAKGRVVAIYVVFDGKRIAHRGDPDGPHRGTWVSMVPGFEVNDIGDELEVLFDGEYVH